MKAKNLRSFLLCLLAAIPFAAQTQTPAPPSMNFHCSPNPVYVGAGANCAVHVGGGASGYVLLSLDPGGSSPLVTLQLDSSGDAVQSTAGYSLPEPYVVVYATYQGDANYGPTQRSEGLTVYSGKVIVTSETLVCSPYAIGVGAAGEGQSTLTCTVHIPGGATGNVAFSIDGNFWAMQGLDASGNAIATSKPFRAALRPHSIQATYMGDVNFGSFITSTSVTAIVSAPQPPSMSVGCSPASVTVGQSGSCTVNVTGGAQGLVDLYIHDQFAVTLTLDPSGKAVAPNLFSSFGVGTYAVTAVYRGDGNYDTASAATTVNVTSGTTTPAKTISCSPEALAPGQPTDCTVRVTPGATGNVLFYIDANYWKTVPLDANSTATATNGFATLPVGTHSLTAYYPGDGNFAPSSVSDGITVSISTARPQPTISVSCSPAPLVVGSATTCTANVGGGATGVVLLDINGPVIAGLGVDASGNARFDNELAGVPVGNYNVRATYQGDQNFSGNSNLVSVAVGTTPIDPTMTVAINPTAVRLGDQARASGHLNGGATGFVDIGTDEGGLIARVPVNATGDFVYAVHTAAGLGDRLYSVHFAYSGDANFNPKIMSAPLNITEDAPPQPGPPTGPTTPPAGSTIYSYSITQPDNTTSGFAPNGNVTAYTDSVNGRWSAGYDGLNRLTSAAQAQISGSPQLAFANTTQQYFCWNYDSFGNRKLQASSDQPFDDLASCAASSSAGSNRTPAVYSGDNRLSTATIGTNNASFSYDDAGNVRDDGKNIYLYDGEGRLCASGSYMTGAMTAYIYDAEGHRVAKGSLSVLSCDASVNGLVITNQYILGPEGEQFVELRNGAWEHTNVSSNGQLIATYQSTKAVHFHLSDWIGTRRVQTDYAGRVELRCSGGSFGDALNCVPSLGGNIDVTEQHFSGKERDVESGLDFFGARYYNSALGRWTAPDSAFPEFGNPQTLNRYRYGLNNPLKYNDPNGQYEVDVHNWLTSALAYAAGYSVQQSLRIAGADQRLDEAAVSNPFPLPIWKAATPAAYSARKNYHFTSPERRAELWEGANSEEGLGVYLHAEQDSFSHAGFGAYLGHLLSGTAPDKTFNDPTKADSMAADTFQALKAAGVKIGVEAGAVPLSEILPFIEAFNRATDDKGKTEQITNLEQYVSRYREQKSDPFLGVGSYGGFTGICPAQYGSCK